MDAGKIMVAVDNLSRGEWLARSWLVTVGWSFLFPKESGGLVQCPSGTHKLHLLL